MNPVIFTKFVAGPVALVLSLAVLLIPLLDLSQSLSSDLLPFVVVVALLPNCRSHPNLIYFCSASDYTHCSPSLSMQTHDINLITPEILVKEPKLLLHKRGFDPETLTAFDGRIGAVVAGGRYFVTSPNMDVVYAPPFGLYRAMRFRSDFRYGEDDPILWPQPYLPYVCHLGCIPLRPSPEDRLAIMWWKLTRADFVASTQNIITGVGLITGEKLAILSRLVSTLQLRVTGYMSDEQHPKKNVVVTSLSNALNHSLKRLQCLPMSFRQTSFGLSQVQRYYLELVAAMDYLMVYKPRMDGVAPPAAQVAATMGAFTTDMLVVQEFVRAGLPVWVLRPYSQLPATRIDALKVPRLPEDYLCLTDATPPYKPFFTGKADDPEKYLSFDLYLRSAFFCANPFDFELGDSSATKTPNQSFKPIPSITGTLSRPTTSLTSRSNKRSQPYSRKVDSKISGGRDKYIDPDSPIIPPAILAWRDALSNVDTSPNNRYNPSALTVSGYAFPEPGLVAGVQSPEKQARFLYNWLKNRPALIYRLTSSTSSARLLSNHIWRTLLNYGGADAQPTAGPSSNITKSFQRRQEMHQLLGNCMEEAGVSFQTTDDTHCVFWRDQQVSSINLPSVQMAQEIMWELYELNFRFEFLALDRRAQVVQDMSLEHQNLLLACFPGDGPIMVTDIDFADKGLASPSLSGRAPYIFAMKTVMKGWGGRIPKEIYVDNMPIQQYTTQDLVALEHAVARFYTQSFFNHFGRAAVIPHSIHTSTLSLSPRPSTEP